MDYKVHFRLRITSADGKRWAYGEKDAVLPFKPFVGLSSDKQVGWGKEEVTSVTWDADNNIYICHIEVIEEISDFYLEFEVLIWAATSDGWSGLDKAFENLA